ncbi:MAG: efflux transporter outer membrane subunit [Janthinobacterium lividum]
MTDIWMKVGPLALRGLAAAITAVAIAACTTVGPNYHAPVVAAPSAWGAEPQDVASGTVNDSVDAQWWKSFHDPELNRLVQRLAHQDLDFETAAERVLQARSQTKITAAAGLPQVDAKAQVVHERVSPGGTASLEVAAPDASAEFNDWTTGLSASWELDLFGRVRRSVEAANASAITVVEAKHAIVLDGLAELASDYLSLRGAQAREGVARANLVTAEDTLRLTRNRLKNGVGSNLDVSRARAKQENIAATLPALRTTEARLINAIGLLLAESPRSLEVELTAAEAALPPVPPVVPVGLPSELVRRRPDVREAEAKLHLATAQTGVAVAAFYPDISLTGTFGTEGLQFSNLFSLYDRSFSVGPSIDLPLFKGGRLKGTLHLRESAQREAALSYKKTVLQAWRDVDDALTAYANAQLQSRQLSAVVEDDKAALTIARQQFAQGTVSYLDLNTAQTSLLGSEDALIRSDLAIRTDLVSLYKALGGGWDVAD